MSIKIWDLKTYWTFKYQTTNPYLCIHYTKPSQKFFGFANLKNPPFLFIMEILSMNGKQYSTMNNLTHSMIWCSTTKVRKYFWTLIFISFIWKKWKTYRVFCNFQDCIKIFHLFQRQIVKYILFVTSWFFFQFHYNVVYNIS